MLTPILLTILGCQDDPTKPTSSNTTETPQQNSLENCNAADLQWSTASFTLNNPCASLQLQPRIIADGSWSVDFIATEDGAWQPRLTTETGGTFYSLVLEGEYAITGAQDTVLWRQGYQSWSWSGIVTPGTAQFDSNGIITTAGDGDAATVFFESDSTSWWQGLLGKANGGNLLIGLQGAKKSRFYLGVAEQQLQAVWGNRGDTITLEAGGTVDLDPIWIATSNDPWELQRDYATVVGSRVTLPVLDQKPPLGWATWYQYYAEVTAEDIYTNFTAIENFQTNDQWMPLELFQIDDGWQKLWGDWTAGPEFPEGMTSLSSDIRNLGMEPGLWLAPFYVSTETQTYQQNPDWWVRDTDGEPIIFTNLNTGNYAIIDSSHPEALDWLGEQIASKVADGWTYLKLDFLYAGAMIGQRHQNITGIEAFHLGMERMREAAGDAWILACGSPMLPSVGYAQSFRTGSDIAFDFDPDPKQDFFRWQSRATAGRSWMNGIWWWNDPDQLIIRDPFTIPQARGALASMIMAGGTWMLGDDLSNLPDERSGLALNLALQDLRGITFRPLDPLRWVSGIDGGPIIEELTPNDQVPPRWTNDQGITILINMNNEPIDVEGPGGRNLLTGEESTAGLRTLAAGDGEIWLHD